MSKPRIIVVSPDDAESFEWLSVGWHQITNRHTPESQRLMGLATKAIDEAENVPEACKALEEAGFEVVRDQDYVRRVV